MKFVFPIRSSKATPSIRAGGAREARVEVAAECRDRESANDRLQADGVVVIEFLLTFMVYKRGHYRRRRAPGFRSQEVGRSVGPAWASD